MPAALGALRRPGFWLACSTYALLVLALLGGGGRGGGGDLLAQLCALVVLSILAWHGLSSTAAPWPVPGWILAIPLLAVFVPVLQLLPLPASIWTLGSARSELATQLSLAGVPLPATWSLNPIATERALWGWLPASALFLSALRLPRPQQFGLLAAFVALAVGNVLLGMAQVAGGPTSELRFYSPTNVEGAVGFFANRNHFAILLAMALPLVICGAAWASVERRRGALRPIWLLAALMLLVLLLFGIALSRSRAGIALAALAMLAGFPLLRAWVQSRRVAAALGGALLVTFLLVGQFVLVDLVQRARSGASEDGRWQYAQVTAQAARAYSPLGSGLGTFRQAYQPFEAQALPGRVVINHAHNDYIELWLEGGWVAIAVLSVALWGWAWAGWRVLRLRIAAGDPFAAPSISRAAWLAISLVVVHEALDYPMRTTAVSSAFALLAAVMFANIFEPARRTDSGAQLSRAGDGRARRG